MTHFTYLGAISAKYPKAHPNTYHISRPYPSDGNLPKHTGSLSKISSKALFSSHGMAGAVPLKKTK